MPEDWWNEYCSRFIDTIIMMRACPFFHLRFRRDNETDSFFNVWSIFMCICVLECVQLLLFKCVCKFSDKKKWTCFIYRWDISLLSISELEVHFETYSHLMQKKTEKWHDHRLQGNQMHLFNLFVCLCVCRVIYPKLMWRMQFELIQIAFVSLFLFFHRHHIHSYLVLLCCLLTVLLH